MGHFYEFADVRLDVEQKVLFKNGQPVAIAPKILELLFALIEQRGRIIEKEALMERVWAGSFVEESNLTFSIRQLRKVLGDDAREPRFIETVPRRGYRFIADVREVEGGVADVIPIEKQTRTRSVAEEEESIERSAGTGGGTALGAQSRFALAVAEETAPDPARRFDAEANNAPLADAEPTVTQRRSLRLVSEETVEQGEDKQAGKPDLSAAGTERSGPVAANAAAQLNAVEKVSSLSPPAPSTGESVIATPRRYPKATAPILALLLVGAAGIAFWVYYVAGPDQTETAANETEVTSLTHTGTTGHAAISPDGGHIVYSVAEAGRESLWLRPTSTSSAQQIVPPAKVEYHGLTFSRDGNHVYFVRTEMKGSVRALYRMLGGVPIKVLEDVHSPITVSPDGSRLAFVRNSRDESRLMIANADGSDQRQLAARPMTDHFKVPAWSPGGKVIACSAGSDDRYDVQNSIIVVQVEDGEQSPASPQKWGWTRWVEWLADGSGLLLTAREHPAGMDQIWHIAYPGGAARRVTNDSKRYRSISLTADSRTLAAVQTELNSDIWVAPEADAARARKVTFGTGSYLDVCYTPDGRIVYASQASGNWDVWVMNADGSGQQQLTAESGVNAHPTVSPDGRYIVFASNRAGVFNIWRMDSGGGNPVRLTGGGGEKFPHWSPDGRWVVYNSVSPNESLYSLWKVSIDGGKPVQVTDRNCERPAVSPDGNRIACFHRDESAGNEYKVVVIPSAGGPPEQTFAVPRDTVPLPFVRWSPDGQALTYTANRDGISNIWTQPLGEEPAKQLTDFKAEGRLRFDWSRDGEQLVWSRHVWTSDLVLLKNFKPGKT